MDKDLRNKTSLHEFKKAVRAINLTDVLDGDAAAMLAQHNYNTTNLGNLELIF